MFKNNNILTHFILPTSIPNTLNPHCFTYTTSAIIKSIPDKHSLAFSCDHMRRSSSIASPHSSQLIYYVRFMRSAYSFHRVCFDAYPISYLFASHLSHYVLNVTCRLRRRRVGRSERFSAINFLRSSNLVIRFASPTASLALFWKS